MLGVLFGVEHPQTKKQQSDGDDKSNPEAHSPDAVVELLPVSREDDHEDNPGRNKTCVYGEAGRQGR
jgi:hypothetical protein